MVLFLLLGILLTVPKTFGGDSPPDPATVKTWISKIEGRTNGWIALRGILTMTFFSENGKAAQCEGRMLYDRFRERLLLECFNDKNELLFSLRTLDRNFELYLGASKTVFLGDIFSLEHSPDIESRLAPLELYRALKLAAIPAENTEIESQDQKTVTLRIRAQDGNRTYCSRILTAEPNGEVPLETYFSPRNVPLAEIRRKDYREITAGEKITGNPVYLPYAIDLASRKDAAAETKKTAIFFRELSLVSSPDEKDWRLSLPGDTKTVDLASS
jgi:hypothetical protein